MQPDPDQARPSLQECVDFWKGRPVFAPIKWDHPDIHAVVGRMNSVFPNGGAKFGVFSFELTPFLHFFLSRNRFGDINFFEHLLASVAFQETFPGVPPYRTPWDSFGWTWSSPYVLGGEIAWTLMSGGPYERFPGSGRDAMALGIAFTEALWGDRFEDIHIVKSNASWSDWFREVAWDGTWIGVDVERSVIWTLFHTGTD